MEGSCCLVCAFFHPLLEGLLLLPGSPATGLLSGPSQLSDGWDFHALQVGLAPEIPLITHWHSLVPISVSPSFYRGRASQPQQSRGSNNGGGGGGGGEETGAVKAEMDSLSSFTEQPGEER